MSYKPDILTAQDFLEQSAPSSTYTWLTPYKVPGLSQRKLLWKRAVEAAGGSSAEAAIILSQLMQETESGTEYDKTKDELTNGARNFSNINLNEDMLYNYGDMDALFQGEKSDLNADHNIETIVRSALVVMHTYGVDRYLHFVRGGRQGFDNPGEDDLRFASSIHKTANTLLQTPESMENNLRFAHSIHHI